jgi:predicted dehydrogenase
LNTPDETMLRIGVIGCGRIAREAHLPALARMSNVQVVALAEPDADRRKSALPRAPEAQTFADGAEMLERCSLDAVVIAAPPDLHAPLAGDAIRRGMHVYLEKPIATSLDEAALLLETWERNKVIAMVGFNYRFHPLYESARDLLNQGAVGRPLAVSSVFASSLKVGGDWRASRSGGGGALLELASHHVDMTHFLFGQRVVDVRAQTSSTHAEAATASLQIRLESGLLINSSFSFGTVDDDRYEIYGELGLLRIDRHLSVRCQLIPVRNQRARLRRIAASLDFLLHSQVLVQKNRAPAHEPSYAKALTEFVNAIRAKQLVHPDLSDGYRALTVIAAAEESAKTCPAAHVFAGGDRP